MARSKKSRRSVCPVACALDLIGDRWTLIVLRDLFVGKAHFREFLESPEGIATNILTSRLHDLCESGLVVARDSTERAGSSAYALTKKGRSLLPVMLAVRDWGLANIAGTRALVGEKGRNGAENGRK
ncbi:MAG: helix-turn-helix transcriptional regulator [Phycisphaeraceae bacterium]|nr:helix-turn-helix transcriptional regulator [Phycisphaeraceae bacterium]